LNRRLAAGAVTVFLASRKEQSFTPPPSAYSIERIGQVRGILNNHG